jgi:hypothetical protein
MEEIQIWCIGLTKIEDSALGVEEVEREEDLSRRLLHDSSLQPLRRSFCPDFRQ